MRACGIIAEYNPCHNGHAYHIEETRKRTQTDCVIVAMSGSFVQRGEPAFLDKSIRTQMALSIGADLVIELPVWSATDSAQGFARGGVALMKSLPGLTHLSFGTECEDLTLLKRIAKILADESEEYKKAYKSFLKIGENAGLARSHALSSLLKEEEISGILNGPNNILALEYLIAMKQLDVSFEALGIPRKGSGYHEGPTGSDFCSAEWLRSLDFKTLTKAEAYLPDGVLSELLRFPYPILPDDLSSELRYLLATEKNFSKYSGISEELSNKIRKYQFSGKQGTFSDTIKALKSRDLTYTHVSRSLLHAVLGLCKEDVPDYKDFSEGFPYLRLLGMNERGRAYLHEKKDEISSVLITESSSADTLLPEKILRLFYADCRATNIYRNLVMTKYGVDLPDEFRRKVIRL